MNGLPWAKDADHSDPQPNPAFTMVYTLRDVDRDVHDGDDDATPSGDAAAFSVTKGSDGYPVLRADAGLTKNVYKLKLWPAMEISEAVLLT